MLLQYSVFEDPATFNALRALTKLAKKEINYRAWRMAHELSEHLTHSVQYYGLLCKRYAEKVYDGSVKVVDGKPEILPENVDKFNTKFTEFMNKTFETKWDRITTDDLKAIGLNDDDVAALVPFLNTERVKDEKEDDHNKRNNKKDRQKNKDPQIQL